jgi:hypothetical protein
MERLAATPDGEMSAGHVVPALREARTKRRAAG